MSRASPRILYVEDDSILARTVHCSLRRVGYAIETVSTLAEAKEKLAISDFDLVFLDFILPDGDADELFPLIRRVKTNPPVLMLTGNLDAELALSLAEECDITLPKPAELETIVDAIERLTGNRRLLKVVTDFGGHTKLSPQEQEVITCALKGSNTDEIADNLGVRPGTIRTYWARIFKKTQQTSQRDVMIALLKYLLRTPVLA